MNMATYSTIITLLYAWALLWMTMDVHFRDLTPAQKWMAPSLLLLLAAVNQTIGILGGRGMLSKLLPLTMHLPVFLFFLYVTKCGVIKMVFMILTALVFTAPIVLVTTYFKGSVPLDSPLMLLINLSTCVVMLLAVFFIFRRGFHYLLKYGDNKLLALFCLVPFLYYVYVFAVANVDLSGMTSASWVILRTLPSLNVYVFYFLLLYNYKELSLRHELELAQAALSRKLDAAAEQLAVLNETQTQSALYRHDMRHHLSAISAFLNEDKSKQAEEYIKQVQTDIEAITPRRFCENELVNLLCSSFFSKAQRLNVRLTVEADVPGVVSISDTELCAVLSNGLENALNAVSTLEENRRWAEFYCGVRLNKLLIEIRNPYAGRIPFRDGLPVSARPNHGRGCSSIRTIAQTRGGLCEFRAEEGIFTVRVALPV